MDTYVDVTWDPGLNKFLPDEKTDIVLDGASRDRFAPGLRSFRIPDGTETTLHVTFKRTWNSNDWTVLQFSQNLYVDGLNLVPLVTPPHSFMPNPLLTIDGGAAVPTGHARIRVATEFVEATHPWFNSAGQFAFRYHDDHDGDTDLVVLAWTRGEPLFWAVSIPKPARFNVPGAIVAFRPPRTATIPDSSESLNRYFLAPVPGAPASEWERRDRLTGGGGVWLRVGMERALDRAGRAVVQLMPCPIATVIDRPQVTGEFAMAATSMLPELVANAMRTLWGLGYVCPHRPDVLPVRRLGLSGFSGGGGGLILALAANLKDVKEIYAFDATGFETNSTASLVKSWAQMHTDDMRLRMTSSRRTPLPDTVPIDSIQAQLPSGIPPDWVTAAAWEPAFWAPGGNFWWDYVLQDVRAAQRDSWDTRHQFAVYGGRNLAPSETPAVSGITWLEEALGGSGF